MVSLLPAVVATRTNGSDNFEWGAICSFNMAIMWVCTLCAIGTIISTVKNYGKLTTRVTWTRFCTVLFLCALYKKMYNSLLGYGNNLNCGSYNLCQLTFYAHIYRCEAALFLGDRGPQTTIDTHIASQLRGCKCNTGDNGEKFDLGCATCRQKSCEKNTELPYVWCCETKNN